MATVGIWFHGLWNERPWSLQTKSHPHPHVKPQWQQNNAISLSWTGILVLNSRKVYLRTLLIGWGAGASKNGGEAAIFCECFENFWPGPCFPLSWLVFSNFKSLVFNAPDLYLTLYIPTRGTHICPSLIVIFRLSKTGCEQLPNFLLASSTLTTDFESLSLLLFKEVYGWKKEPWFLFQKWLMGKKYLQTKFYHWSQKPFTVDCSSILPRLRFLIFTIVWQGTFLIKGLLTINVSISWRWPAKHYCKLLIQ